MKEFCKISEDLISKKQVFNTPLQSKPQKAARIRVPELRNNRKYIFTFLIFNKDWMTGTSFYWPDAIFPLRNKYGSKDLHFRFAKKMCERSGFLQKLQRRKSSTGRTKVPIKRKHLPRTANWYATKIWFNSIHVIQSSVAEFSKLVCRLEAFLLDRR